MTQYPAAARARATRSGFVIRFHTTRFIYMLYADTEEAHLRSVFSLLNLQSSCYLLIIQT